MNDSCHKNECFTSHFCHNRSSRWTECVLGFHRKDHPPTLLTRLKKCGVAFRNCEACRCVGRTLCSRRYECFDLCTARHRNTLQHTATHCNTLRRNLCLQLYECSPKLSQVFGYTERKNEWVSEILWRFSKWGMQDTATRICMLQSLQH